MLHNFKTLPVLPRHAFEPSKMAQRVGISHMEVYDYESPSGLKVGWKAVGWIHNDKLLWKRPDEDLIGQSTWVAVRFEQEDGTATWFHEIADIADLPEGSCPPVKCCAFCKHRRAADGSEFCASAQCEADRFDLRAEVDQ